MKDYQASYSEKFKEALRKFNDSATALYFVVQTSTSHDYEDPFTTVTVYNKKKNTDWEAPLLSEFCSDPNKDLIATYQKVSLTTKLGKESINITVIKNVIGFGIATSLDQVKEIITYMEADNRDLRKIYFYDYDLVIQELVPAQPNLPLTSPNFTPPINSAWNVADAVIKSAVEVDGDAKKKKGKKQVDEHPTPGVIPGFNN